MPQSPYLKMVHPPISDLGEWKRALVKHRVGYDNEEENDYAEETLLEIGEVVMAQCEFLEDKLEVKEREHKQLVKQHKEEKLAQKKEIATLKAELEKMKASAEPKEQPAPNCNGTQVGQTEKPGEGKSASETMHMAN
ncbi:MAG: hypothetical protein M1817_006441 [Caeruleum heppii]|nr:MAG: hypothetical protein M1817_006441 [Caeruleum heppii]